jgi:SAM-dependent methyltransferase
MGRRLSLIGVKDEDVLYDLSNEVFATYSYGLQGESELQVAVTLRASSDYRPVAVDFGKSLKGVQLEWRPERYVMSTHVAVARGTISAIDRDKTVVFNFERESDVARLNSNSKLRQLAVPQSLFDSARLKFPLPSADNIARVSGPLSTKHHYLVGGFTTFKQIASLVSTYGRTPLDKMTCIVDWGVGCARVARQFVEGADELNMAPIAPNSYLGYDVDPVNVEWCSRNMAAFGSYHLLSRSGFDLDKSADLLFGVSVFTHLTEADQLLWLQGIHRVVRPGGLVIVTTHGEHFYYKSPQSIAIPFLERFGFFDGFEDPAIGKDRVKEYRATYHSREYVRRVWGQYFEILDVVPAVNAFVQDFIVMCPK